MMGLRTTFSKLIGSMEPNRTHANGAPDLLCILEEEGYKDTEKLGGKVLTNCALVVNIMFSDFFQTVDKITLHRYRIFLLWWDNSSVVLELTKFD